jgi:hypothetical protein
MQNPTAAKPQNPQRVLSEEVANLVDLARTLDKAADELREKVFGPLPPCEVACDGNTEKPTLASLVAQSRLTIQNVTSLIWDISGRLA